MSAAIEAVPVGRITEQARRTAATHSVGRAMLALIAGLFFAVGWLAAQAWFAVVWSGTAVKVGWQDARTARAGGARGPAR